MFVNIREINFLDFPRSGLLSGFEMVTLMRRAILKALAVESSVDRSGHCSDWVRSHVELS